MSPGSMKPRRDHVFSYLLPIHALRDQAGFAACLLDYSNVINDHWGSQEQEVKRVMKPNCALDIISCDSKTSSS